MSQTTQPTDKQEQEQANAFVRQCTVHLSNANDIQKATLLQALLERPPGLASPVKLAQQIWNGLTQPEIMSLLGLLQKQFDKETWEFISKWRTR